MRLYWSVNMPGPVNHRRSEMRHALHAGLILFAVLCSQSVASPSSSNSTGDFVDRCYSECTSQKDFVSCGKYRLVRWLENVKEKEFSYGPVRMLRLPSMPYQDILPRLPQTRAFRGSVTEILNFVRETVDDFLSRRVIVHTVENPSSARSLGSGPMIVDDDELERMKTEQEPIGDWRIFKKKKSFIIPLLILLNLIKVKLLLLPIFLGVHFIKKALVLGGLFVPSLLAHLKVCKVPKQPQISYHAWPSAAEAPDYPTGYAQDETSWLHRNDQNFVYPSHQVYHNPYG